MQTIFDLDFTDPSSFLNSFELLPRRWIFRSISWSWRGETCSSWLWFRQRTKFWQSYRCVCLPRWNSPSLSITSSIFEYLPSPIIEKLARMRMATRFEGGSRLARVNFFPNGEQRVHERERKKKLEETLSISPRNRREIIALIDTRFTSKERKKERRERQNAKLWKGCNQRGYSP